jgi:type VI protein secretion system component VasK
LAVRPEDCLISSQSVFIDMRGEQVAVDRRDTAQSEGRQMFLERLRRIR